MHDLKSIHEDLCAIARTRLELHAREARLLVLAEDLALWRQFGCATLLEYLERFCDLHPRTAREYLRVARALTVLPIMRDQLEARQISYSTVRELTRIATPGNEALWLNTVAGLSAREVEEEVAGRAYGDGPDDPKDPDRLVRLVLSVRESTYAAFIEARCRYADEQGESLSDDDVILAMCRERPVDLDTEEAEPEDASVPPKRRGVASYLLSITTCRTCRKSFLLASGREVEVPQSLLETAQCDARFLGALDADTPPRALSSVTPRMKEQVLARDGHRCSVPGCRARRFLDVHHIQLESRGGPNVMWNLTTLCSLCRARHNEHYAGYAVMPGSDGLSTTTKSAARHNQRLFRNVSSASSGRNRPVVTCSGAVRFRAPSFIARSASRYICVVSMDS